MSYPGTLEIDVDRAYDVPKADVGGKSDPYVTIEYNKDRRETSVKRETLNPVWNQSLPSLVTFFSYTHRFCFKLFFT